MNRTALASLLFTLGLASAGAAQTPTWSAELLGTPPPTWSLTAAVAVNDAGQAVGNSYVASTKRAWIGAPRQALGLLPLPAGATYCQAYDINASGVVAGSVLLSSGTSQAVIWQPGPAGYDAILLGAGPGGFVPFDARGINDAGDVVGKYGILGGSYHWSAATGITQLTTATFPVVPVEVNEQRQIIGGSYRMDLDTLVLEDLGNPTGTTYNYVYTEFGSLNDAGECAGYAVVATSLPPYLPVRYTDGPAWKVFSNFPLTSASALGLAASGDTVFQLGIYGIYVYVNGFGSVGLQDTLAPISAGWDLTNSFAPAISRGGRLACTGSNSSTGESGIVLLTPYAFEDLGGASAGALGDPVLSGYGTLVPGQPVRVRLSSAAPNSAGRFLTWSTPGPPVANGGIQAAKPKRAVPFQTDALGRAELNFDWPSVPAGTTIHLKARISDPLAVGGLARSNTLAGLTQ